MAILKKIEIVGYKSIERAEIELGPINVLIGANGAGKSNLISLFNLLYEMRQGRLQNFVGFWGADALLFREAKTTKTIETKLGFDGEGANFVYRVCLAATAQTSLQLERETLTFPMFGGETAKTCQMGCGIDNYESRLSQAVEDWRRDESPEMQQAARLGEIVIATITKWGIFHFHDTSPEAKIRRRCYVDNNRSLQSDGSNLAAMLRKFQLAKTAAYWRILETIRQIAPWFGDFVLEPINPNETDVMLNWRDRYSDNVFGPHQLPDGALRAMALITLLLQPWEELPPLLIVDEPELGLHPSAICIIAALLKQASLHCQVIIATQSPTLLDEFEPEDVIVVDRVKETSTFTRQNPEQLREWLEEYTIGELWQKNSIGGGPF